MGKTLGIPLGMATAVANIVDVINDATPAQWAEGAEWYATAQREALALGVGLECGAAVIAATSPRTMWSQNLQHARAIVSGTDIPSGVLTTNDIRGRRAFVNGIAGLGNGPKVNAFARNIMGDMNEVTVDTWAMVALKGSAEMPITCEQFLKRTGGYEWAADAYRAAASIIGSAPAIAQAVAWVVVRHDGYVGRMIRNMGGK